MLTEDQVSTQVLDHLGLIVAVMDKIGLQEKIDARLPLASNTGVKITMGQRVMAMILNGLGFMDDRLYMFPEFLKNKPVQRLFGDSVQANSFNDDALGRCLDAIYDYGVTLLFSELAFEIGLHFGLLGKTARFDTTSLMVYGDYENQEEPGAGKEPFEVTYGYSKDGRPDLKQVVLTLATTGLGNLPIWMAANSGNASDKVVLQQAAERMKTFAAGLKEAPSFVFVGDSAMYEKCVEKAGDMLWLSRVPSTNKAAQETLALPEKALSWEKVGNGYQIARASRYHTDVPQRWLLVFSEQMYQRDLITLDKRITTEKEAAVKTLWHLSHQVFGCETDADKALKKATKGFKYHTASWTFQEVRQHKTKGRPKKDAVPEKVGCKIIATLTRDEEKIALKKQEKGRFILATNQGDDTVLSDADMLHEYKQQIQTEAGFRFIKGNAFEVSGIFLKKPSRIQALMMVMTLCLMVYNLGQHFLREALGKNNDTLPNQLKKPTNKPTMQRVCQMFQGIHVVSIQFETRLQERVSNLTEILKKIIGYFGPVAQKIYGLSG